MSKQRAIAIFACALALLHSVSAPAATGKGRVSARVVETLAVVSKTPLVFGYLMPGSAAGTVTVTTANKRKESGKVHMLPGFYERATFTVKGTPNRSYTMHVPQSLTFTGKDWLLGGLFSRGKVSDLVVKDFTTRSDNLGRDGTAGKLSKKGTDKIYLGGTLIVPKNVAPGLYSGLVPLTVAY